MPFHLIGLQEFLCMPPILYNFWPRLMARTRSQIIEFKFVEFFDRVQKNPPTKVLMQITMKEITTTLFHLTPCMLKFQCVKGKVILNKVSNRNMGGEALLPKCTSWNQYFWTKCAFGELPTLASKPYLWCSTR